MKTSCGVRLVFTAPEQCAMNADVKAHLDEHRIPYHETTRLDEALPSLDALYVTRMQTEWDTAGESRAVDLTRFSIGTPQLAKLKRDAIIMHPLPRGPEIDPVVDQDPRAMYWRQERNGMWMRAAVLSSASRKSTEILNAVFSMPAHWPERSELISGLIATAVPPCTPVSMNVYPGNPPSEATFQSNS
jgi:aspartate carbamoyltransferase catalytic subunit